jgi:hypothetical protein
LRLARRAFKITLAVLLALVVLIVPAQLDA